MREMEELLKKCESGQIFFEIDNSKRFLGSSFGDKNRFACWINSNLDEYEQVFTLAHEKIHLHSRYNGKSDVLFHDKDVEKKMDEDVLNIFIQNPEIFNYLIEQIRLAKVRCLNESINGELKKVKYKTRMIIEELKNRRKYPWLADYSHRRLNIYEEPEELKSWRVQALKES